MAKSKGVGDMIKKYREEKGVSQEEMARACDISHMTIWKIEIGKTKSPDLETIDKIATFLGVSRDSLI